MALRSPAAAWALLALFILYASGGTWTAAGPGIWGPLAWSWPDVAQNVLVYIPFGILGVLTMRHRRHRLAASIVEVAAIAALFSGFVEVLQLYTLDRIASLTDLFAAVGGAIAGGLLAQPFTGAADVARSFVRPSGVLDAAELPVLAVLIGAIVIAAWWPLDPTLDVSTLAARWRGFRNDFWQFDRPTMISQALIYACLTLVIATCATRLRTLSAATAATVAATGLALIVDASQLAMGARPIGLAAVGSQIAGVMVGGAAFAALRGPR